MEITRHLRRTDTDSLAKGPIEPYFDAFKQYLAQHGYAAHTSSSYLIGMLPIGLALIIFVINPTYISKLFLPGWTLCIPIGAVISWISGFLVIRKVVDIKV